MEPTPGNAEGGQDADAVQRQRRAVLMRWFTAFGLRVHDAEDCTHDALVRVESASATYVPRAPFEAFLRRVARSVHVDWCRRQRVRRTAAAPLEGPEVEALVAPAALHPSEVLDLRAAVSRLPEKLGDVIELSVRQGLSHREVAQRLDIPVGTVKSRMYLAVQRMRKELRHD